MSLERNDRIAGLLYGSLVADALALGAHWIYDQEKMKRDLGRVTEFLDPRSDSYHKTKKRGQQTHYGDQALTLMASIQANHSFKAEAFPKDWEKMWDGYTDYFDHATKETLANMKAGTVAAGSKSEELGGAARIAPLLVAQEGAGVGFTLSSVGAQTLVTHGSQIAVDAAEFLTRIVFALLDGTELSAAISRAGDAHYEELNFAEMQRKVDAQKSRPISAAAEALGLACPAPQALPTLLLLLERCGDNFENALIENVMAGGDNAARGLALGMILGAKFGKSGIPARWLTGLEAAPQVEEFLKAMDENSQKPAAP